MLDAVNAAARLRYADVIGDPTFDPLRNSRFGWQLARRYLLFLLVGAAADTLIMLFFLLTALTSGSSSVTTIGTVLSFVVQAVLLVAYLVMPVPALLAQWSRVLGFRAEAADIAFDHITQAMHRHETPYDSFGPKTMMPPGEGIRKYLELRRGVFAFYISCFPHGRDLYCGWTFWIYMSPLRWITMKIGRQIQDWSGRGNDMFQTLRYESTRATIAAAHSCTVEGIDIAIRTLDPGAELLGDEATVSMS